MIGNLSNSKQKTIAAIAGIILYVLLANSRFLDNGVFVQAAFGLKTIIPVVFGILFGGYLGAIVGVGGAVANGLITGNSVEWISILGNMVMGMLGAKLTDRFMAPITGLALIPGYLIHLIMAFFFGFIDKGLLATNSFWLSMGFWTLANICGVTISIRLFRMCFHYDDDVQVKHTKKPLVFTSDKRIWMILGAAFVALTAILAVLFYFEDIFITFIVGSALIVLTERIKGEYQERMISFGISERRRKIYGYLLLIFWLIITVALLWTSINQINAAVVAARSQSQDVTTTYIANLRPYVPELLAGDLLSRENVIKAEAYLLGLSTKFIANVGVFAFNAILIIPLLFFLYFKKKNKIFTLFYSHVPKEYHSAVMHSFEDMGNELHTFFSAKVIESLIVSVICALGFYVAGLKGWLLLGFLAGFFNIVPYIGPIMGAIPPILLGLLDSPATAWYVIITVVISQIIDNFYLQPFMVSGKVKIDALLSIILVLIGAKLFGVLGMVFALPIYSVYKIILVELYTHLYNVKHKLKVWR